MGYVVAAWLSYIESRRANVLKERWLKDVSIWENLG